MSWRRRSVAEIRIECSARATVIATTTIASTNIPIRISLVPVPVASRENSSVSSNTEAKSAIDAAAITSWPKRDLASPASWSTGTITPSEVEARMTAISSGESTIPAAYRAKAAPSASASEIANPSRGLAQQAALERRQVDLEPGEEEQEGEAQQGEHLDRLVDLDPSEHRRPEHDPEHDLQHHRGQPQLRRQAEHERRREPGDDDDQQVVERELHLSDPMSRARRTALLSAPGPNASMIRCW